VDELRVVCHDMADPPECVKELANEWVCVPDKHGSAAKLRWADQWQGLYLGCDDDLIYPADYVERTDRWLKRWKGRAIITWSGRILHPTKSRFNAPLNRWHFNGTTPGTWVNYPCAAVLAFDTRLNVPPVVPGKSLEEAHLAVWAQRQRIPIWQVPHGAGEFTYLLDGSDLPTIWAEQKAKGFADRDAILAPYGAAYGWEVLKCR
jgi:hypothetical protein